MHVRLRTMVASFTLLALLLISGQALAADTYKIDAAHTSVGFAARHAGISWVHGRFGKYSGSVVLDESDIAKSKFNLSIAVDSVDTNQPKRDEHLKSPDFFNEKQFPTITFTSTKVQDKGDSLNVTGDFTMHGVTRSIMLELTKGGKAEFPQGVQRVGYTTETSIKRSDYGMDNYMQVVGDEVKIMISFEAVKQ